MTIPDLASYDILLANISGGKDSQTMLRRLVRQAAELGIKDRIVCVFADLGARSEWKGTPEIVQAHASHYGLPLITVQKRNRDGETVDLLDHIEARGMWPDAKNRYCTSDTKRDPIATIMTRLVREAQERLGTRRQIRILNVQGLRAQESASRKLMAPFRNDSRATNGRRHVDIWLPIHEMTLDEVWADIRESGVPYHYAYDLGMPRLSCMFCVLASKQALIVSAQNNPEAAAGHLAAEERMGHTFQNGRSIKDIIREAEAATAAGIAVKAPNWEG